MKHFSSSRRVALSRLAALPLAPLAACGDDLQISIPGPIAASFAFEGLQGRIVKRLRPHPSGLIAATDDGLYQRSAGGWLARGLSGEDVADVAAVDERHWLASATQRAAGARLLQTRDGGQSWRELANDFGGPDGPEPIQALVYDGAARRLLATGYDAMAQSTDGGAHWQLLAGDWQAFAHPKSALTFDPQLGDVWYGGQDAIEGLALFRYRQATGERLVHAQLMPSPSVAKGIRFAASSPQRVLVSGEGGIVHTRDLGASWQPLLRDDGHRFYFDVVQDPRRPQRWATARWEKNFDSPQPLVVSISEDDGANWRPLQHPDSRLFGGVWSMAVGIEGGRTIVHLGLYRGGVMRLSLD